MPLITDPEVSKWYAAQQKKPVFIDKFKTIRNFKYERNYVFQPKITNRYNMCLVYCAWGNSFYLDWLYLSLVSQYKLTDVACIDVKVFVEQHFFEEARNISKNFPVEVIPITCEFMKFSVLSHEKLKEYDRICICDCDTFAFGEFKDIYRMIYNTNDQDIFMMHDPDKDTLKIFEQRIMLCKTIRDIKQYREFFASYFNITPDQLVNLILGKKWFLSCMACFHKSFYKSEQWDKYAELCQKARIFCDETVFLVYAWCNNFAVKDLSEIGVDNYCSDNFKNCNGFGLLHPLHGDTCHDASIGRIYKKILEN